MCNGDNHVFAWGSNNTSNNIPNGLSCQCGACYMEHGQIKTAKNAPVTYDDMMRLIEDLKNGKDFGYGWFVSWP